MLGIRGPLQRWNSTRGRRFRLRTLLFAPLAAISLLVVALLVAGAGWSLQNALIANVDEQIRSRAGRINANNTGHAVDVLEQSPLPTGYLLVFIGGDRQVSGVVVAEDGSSKALSSEGANAVLANFGGGDIQTISADGDTYRVAALHRGPEIVGALGVSLGSARSALSQSLIWLVAVGLAETFLLLAAFAWVLRRQLALLTAMALTASAVSRTPLTSGDGQIGDHIEIEGDQYSKEVGELAESMNGMPSHVDAALTARAQKEQQMRSFVADASHELRTPLALIRGMRSLDSEIRRSRNSCIHR